MELLDIPYTEERYPKMYRVFDHPLNPTTHGKTYVFIIDTSKSAMSTAYLFEKMLTIPKGTAKEVAALGE